jgi:hypothetical protein
MAFVEWSMEGLEAANCNCDWGCPCQFNRLPTHGDCRAYAVMQIERGRFGDVPLDGLRWGILAAWPGAVHQGNGTLQVIVDDRATAPQRAALEAVGHGRETEPGTLVWQVFSTTVTKFLPTVSAPIAFSADLAERSANVAIGGILDGRVAPITNAVTGAPHRVRVTLPHGFEFTEAEFASGTARASGDIALDFTDTHAHLARIHWSTHGVVRPSPGGRGSARHAEGH